MSHEITNWWVYDEGRCAFLEGRPLNSNPYQRSSASWQDWFNGWEFQQANPSSPLDQSEDTQVNDEADDLDDDDRDCPEDTPSIQSADLWGTGEGRHHGII